MHTMIICVASLARAGKDTFADYVSSKYGFEKLNMSDVLRNELLKEGKEPTKDNMSKLGDEWRKKHGMDIVMRKTLETALKHDRVVITGVRSMEEVNFMRNNAEVCLIAITASPEVRYSRRNELDPQSKGDFFARDERDIKNKGLDKVIAMADCELKNDFNNHQEFYAEIDRMIAGKPGFH